MSDHPDLVASEIIPPQENSSSPREIWQLLQRLKQEKQELEAALAEAHQENHKQRQRLLNELDIAQHTIQRQQQQIHHLSQELQRLREQPSPRSFTSKVVELPSFLRRSL